MMFTKVRAACWLNLKNMTKNIVITICFATCMLFGGTWGTAWWQSKGQTELIRQNLEALAEGEVYEGYVERRSLNGGSSSTEYKNPDGSSVIVVTFWEEQTCWGVGSEYCKYYRNVWTGI